MRQPAAAKERVGAKMRAPRGEAVRGPNADRRCDALRQLVVTASDRGAELQTEGGSNLKGNFAPRQAGSGRPKPALEFRQTTLASGPQPNPIKKSPSNRRRPTKPGEIRAVFFATDRDNPRAGIVAQNTLTALPVRSLSQRFFAGARFLRVMLTETPRFIAF